MFAAYHKLAHLTAIVDYNKRQLDDFTAKILDLEPLVQKWTSFGWNAVEIDGHDFNQVIPALEEARRATRIPTVIIAHTVKGKGISYMEGTLSFHGKPPSKDELVKAQTEFDITRRRLEQRRQQPPAAAGVVG